MRRLESVKAKLIDLANMHIQENLAGTEEQRNCLKVKLFRIKFARDLCILWQIDVGINSESGILQQEVKVWEIGNATQIAKAIDRVVTLQKHYSEDTIHQCGRCLLLSFVFCMFPLTECSACDSLTK